VRVIYDWRLARVIDADNQIIDELYWNRISTKNLVNRLSDLQSGRLTPEARTLKERFPESEIDYLGALSDSEWPDFSDDEIEKFIQASTRLAKRGVAESSGDIDRRMDMLVSANNELRASWNTLEARCIEWVGLFLSDLNLDEQRKKIPEIVSKSKSINDVAKKFDISKPKHQPSPQPKPAPKSEVKRPDKREDRLADLRAKSAATAQFAKEAQDAKKATELEVDSIKADVVPETEKKENLKVEEAIIEVPKSEVIQKGVSNVFKTIKTEVKKSDRKPKRRRPAYKRGGGRQPQSKKLDRRKYLEYKYAARELLENDSISEEHRSNILGQIWAKGERSGVDEAIEFINQKEAELIIPEEVAEEFRKMVKRYTTKR